MCGRFTLTQSSSAIATEFHTDVSFAIEPRYNIAPTQPVLVIVGDSQREKRQATHVSWGLIPSWAKDLQRNRPMINARAETVAEKPSFRAAFRRRRCLIPANGFYEWKKDTNASNVSTSSKSSKAASTSKASKSAKAPKQPFYIQPQSPPSLHLPQHLSSVHLPSEEQKLANPCLFAFAGIWDHWQSSDGSDLYSCAILTMPANEAMKPIHHRMPVILTPNNYEQWLTLSNTDMQPFMESTKAIALRLTPVSPRINNPRFDSPECLTPA